MTDKFYLKEVCGEYKFYEEGDGFPLTEKQILNKLNENEQLKQENKELKEELNFYKNQCIDEDIKYLRENTVWEQMPTKTRTYTKTSIRDDLND